MIKRLIEYFLIFFIRHYVSLPNAMSKSGLLPKIWFRMTLWESRKKIRVESSARNYLVVSVRNQCLNYLKREGYKQNYIDAYLAKNADQSDYDEFYLLTELQKLLDEALAKLPQTYRLIFEMSRLENNSNTEIAEKLNIPLRTVERYKAKAIEILKKDLKDYLPLLLYFHLLS